MPFDCNRLPAILRKPSGRKLRWRQPRLCFGFAELTVGFAELKVGPQRVHAASAIAGLTLLALLQGCAVSASRPMQLIHDVGPTYPEQAKAAGVQGWVKVRYDISADGRVENLLVAESQPPGLFDAAALTAVAQWRYRPAVIDGAASRVSGVVSTLRFQLGGAERYQGY